MLYPSGYHVVVTSASGAPARASKEGYFSSHSWYFGSTRSTCVCCSMISETRMWYGFAVARQGRERPLTSYHTSSFRRKTRRAGASGIANRAAFLLRAIRRGFVIESGRILTAMKIYTRTGDAG